VASRAKADVAAEAMERVKDKDGGCARERHGERHGIYRLRPGQSGDHRSKELLAKIIVSPENVLIT